VEYAQAVVDRDKPQGREYYEQRRRPRWLGQCFFPLPRKEDVEVKLVSEKEVRSTLKGAGDAVKTAAGLLDRAERVQSSREERERAAEARATTLLGTVSIAASLVIAGAGLILDDQKVTGDWSEWMMAIVALLLFFLLVCGFTASRAVLKVRIQVEYQPRIRHALEWARNPDASEVRVKRVMDLVTRADDTLYVAEYKRAQLKVAYYWYRAALLSFGLLGIVFLAYALAR
jgi:hypothetical protein